MTTQRHITRFASRVASTVVVSATVEYRNGRYVYLAVIYFACAIFIYHEIVCFAKGIIIPFAYNSSESGSGHNRILI